MKPERISEVSGKPLERWRQHLLDAAAYIEEHGHCKGDLDNAAGGVCVMGAILRTRKRHGSNAFSNANQGLERHLGEHSPVWNDRPETTKEMAVAALIGAALS